MRTMIRSSVLFLASLVLVLSGCTEEQGNHEDNHARRFTVLSQEDSGVVQSIIKDYGHGIRLVRVGSINSAADSFAHYALATDPAVTNGTHVYLVVITHDDTTTTEISQHTLTSRLAIPITWEGGF